MPGSVSVAMVVILAVVIASVGVYYVFISPAARRLAKVEASHDNALRQRLRRFNGGVLIVLAGLFAAGSLLQPRGHPWLFLLIWAAVVLLLAVLLALARADMKLTGRLRRRTLQRP